MILHCQEEILKIMIIGIPNVGKSSLINALRRNYLRKGNLKLIIELLHMEPSITGKGAHTGKEPGVTRRLSQFIKVLVEIGIHWNLSIVDTIWTGPLKVS